jgi:hypothetical protein
MTEEDEEFNRIEREAAMRKEAVTAVVANHYVDGGHLVYPTEQRTWAGLTDEEIDELHGSPMSLEHSGELKWVRIIEAKLKEKNT